MNEIAERRKKFAAEWERLGKAQKQDQGAHYRFEYKGIKLDPARICKIYKIESLLIGQAIKKLLVAGGRGNKSYEQDLKDVICAVTRELEMIEEDK